MRVKTIAVVAVVMVFLSAAAWSGATNHATSITTPAAAAPAAISPGWPIDKAHSRVIFTVSKWDFVEVEGRFFDFAGTIAYDPAHPEAARADWRVRVASVETGAPNRDKSLQSEEYFDAAHYPEMRFVSTQVKSLGANKLEVQGTLTIRGQSKPMTLPVTYGGVHMIPGEGTFEAFQTDFTLNRYDFGVKGGTVLGLAISRDVHVKITAVVNHP